jgi:hypothetical protein
VASLRLELGGERRDDASVGQSKLLLILFHFLTHSTLDRMTSLIDRRGKVVIPAEPGLSWIDRFSERLIQRKDVMGRTGYVDRTGRFVLPGRWQFAGRFRDGLAAVMRGNKWGMIDRAGQEVIQPIWDGISLKEGGLFQALQYLGEKASGFDSAPGRMCYLNSTGKIIWSSDEKASARGKAGSFPWSTWERNCS